MNARKKYYINTLKRRPFKRITHWYGIPIDEYTKREIVLILGLVQERWINEVRQVGELHKSDTEKFFKEVKNNSRKTEEGSFIIITILFILILILFLVY